MTAIAMDASAPQPVNENPDVAVLCTERLIAILGSATADTTATPVLGRDGILELATTFNYLLARLFAFSSFTPEECALLQFNFICSRLFDHTYLTATVNRDSSTASSKSRGSLLKTESKMRQKLLGYRDRARNQKKLVMAHYSIEDVGSFYYSEGYIFSRLFLELHAAQLPLTMCGKVLQHNLGFKCQQCTTDKSSVLCLDCFDESKHVGHEYRCFFSTGLCDCGNVISTGTTGVCAKHVGDRQVKDPIEIYKKICGPACNLVGLCKVAVLLTMAFFQSIIFPADAFLLDDPQLSVHDDSVAVWTTPSAKTKMKVETDMQMTIALLFNSIFVDFKVDGFWRLLAQVLITPITATTTIQDILSVDASKPFYYRDVEAIMRSLGMFRMMLALPDSLLAERGYTSPQQRGASTIYALMRDRVTGLVLSDILLSLQGFKVLIDTEVHRLQHDLSDDGLTGADTDAVCALLTVKVDTLDKYLEFIVDGLIFEPMYRLFLCNIFHWYQPYLLMETFEGNCFADQVPFALHNFEHSFMHKPLLYCKHKPRFIHMHRSFAYNTVCISGLNDTINYLSSLQHMGGDGDETQDLRQYLIEEHYPDCKKSRRIDVWTRAAVQIYTEFNPSEAVRHLVSSYLLSALYLSMSIGFVPNYLHKTRADLLKKYVSEIIDANYIGCTDPAAPDPATDDLLTQKMFRLIFHGLDEERPYLPYLPSGFFPIVDHDRDDRDMRFFTSIMYKMERFFEDYMASCLGSHHPVSYSGKMGNFTQSCFFHLLPATAVLAIVSAMSAIDAIQVMRGNHVEHDYAYVKVCHIAVLTYSDLVMHFTYGAWFCFVHGTFYDTNPASPDDTTSRKHCDGFKLSELRARFGHSDDEVRECNARILAFLKALIMFILTINGSEAQSFEPTFQGGVMLEQERELDRALQQDGNEFDDDTVTRLESAVSGLEVYMYHPIFLPLHGILAYTLGAVSTRNVFGIAQVLPEDILAEAIACIVQSGYYADESPTIQKIQLLNLCNHRNNTLKRSTLFGGYLKRANMSPEEAQQAKELGLYDSKEAGEFVSLRLVRSRHAVWNQYKNIVWNEACLPALDPRTRVALELVLLPFKVLTTLNLDASSVLLRSGIMQSNMLQIFSSSSGSYSTGVLALGNVCQSVLKYLYSQRQQSPHGLEAFFFLLFNLVERRLILERDRANKISVRSLTLKLVFSLLCFDYSPRSVENLLALIYLPKLTGASNEKTIVDIVDSSVSLSFWREPTVMALLNQFCDIITPVVENQRTDVYSIGNRAAYYQLSKRGWAYTSIYSPLATSQDYVDAWEQYCKETRSSDTKGPASEPSQIPVPQCVAGLSALSNGRERLDGDYADLVSVHGNGLNKALTAAVLRIPCMGAYICQVFSEAVLAPFTQTDVEVSLRPTVVLCLCNAFYLLHHYVTCDVLGDESSEEPAVVDPDVKAVVVDIYERLYTHVRDVSNSGITHCYFNDSVMNFLRTVMYQKEFTCDTVTQQSEAPSRKTGAKRGKNKLAFLKNKLGTSEQSLLMTVDDLPSVDTSLTRTATESTADLSKGTLTTSCVLLTNTMERSLLYDFLRDAIVNIDTSCYTCRCFDTPEMAICQPMAFVPNSLNRLYMNVLKTVQKSDHPNTNILEHPWLTQGQHLLDSDLKPWHDRNSWTEAKEDREVLPDHFQQILSLDAHMGLVFSKHNIVSAWKHTPMSTSIADRLYDVPTVRYFIRVAGCKHFFHSECVTPNATSREPRSCFICRRLCNTYLPVVTSYKSANTDTSSEGIAALEKQILEEFTLQSQAMALCMSNIMYHGTSNAALAAQRLNGMFVNYVAATGEAPLVLRLLVVHRASDQPAVIFEDAQASIYNSWYIMFADLVLHNVFLALHGFSVGVQCGLFTGSRLMTNFEGNLSAIGSIALLMQMSRSFLQNEYAPLLYTIRFDPRFEPQADQYGEVLPVQLFSRLHCLVEKLFSAILDIQTKVRDLPEVKHMYGFVDDPPKDAHEGESPEKIVYWEQGNTLILTSTRIPQPILNCNRGGRELSSNAQKIIPSVYNYARITSSIGMLLQVFNRMIGIIGAPLFMHYLVRFSIRNKLLVTGEDVSLPFLNMVENPAVVFVALFLAHEVGVVSVTAPSLIVSESLYGELHQEHNVYPSEVPSYGSYCQREALMARELVISHAPLVMKHTANYNLAAFAADVADALNTMTRRVVPAEDRAPWSADAVLSIFTCVNSALGILYPSCPDSGASDDDHQPLDENISAMIARFEHRNLAATIFSAIQSALIWVAPSTFCLLVYMYKASHVLAAIDLLFGRVSAKHAALMHAHTDSYADYARNFCMTHLRNFVKSRFRLSLNVPPSSYGLYDLSTFSLTPMDYFRRYLYKIFPFSRTAVEALKKHIADEQVCSHCRYKAGNAEKRNVAFIVCMMCGQCFCNFCGHTHTNLYAQRPPNLNLVSEFLNAYNRLDVWTPMTQHTRMNMYRSSILLSILHHSAACILPAVFYLPAYNNILCINGSGMIWSQAAPMVSRYGDADMYMAKGVPVELVEDQVNRLFATVVINGLLDLPVGTNGMFSMYLYST